MESGLTLQANFSPNPFRPLTGTYNGLFYNPGAPANGNAGSVILTLTGSGAYSGRLVLMGVSYPFTGEFNASLQSQKSISRFGRSALQRPHSEPLQPGVKVASKGERRVVQWQIADSTG